MSLARKERLQKLNPEKKKSKPWVSLTFRVREMMKREKRDWERIAKELGWKQRKCWFLEANWIRHFKTEN